MVVNHLKDFFFFLFFNMYLNSSACVDEYIFIKLAGTTDPKWQMNVSPLFIDILSTKEKP